MKTRSLTFYKLPSISKKAWRIAVQQYRNRYRCRRRWDAYPLVVITFFYNSFLNWLKKGISISYKPHCLESAKKETIYCYSEQERIDAIEKLGQKPEITRFKGLGRFRQTNSNTLLERTFDSTRWCSTGQWVLTSCCHSIWEKTPKRQEFILIIWSRTRSSRGVAWRNTWTNITTKRKTP